MAAVDRRAALLRLGALAAAGVACAGARASPPAEERLRIERLIAFVESQPAMSFVRNGKSYTAPQAAKFLRGKLEAMGSEVRSARQFIEQIASKSSTTGKPYTVVWPDGRSLPAGQFLSEELARIDRGP